VETTLSPTDLREPEAELKSSPRDSTLSESRPLSSNLFRSYFKKIHRTSDMDFIVSGIVCLLRNPIDADRAYLPGATKKINMTSELLILLWSLLTTSPVFFEYFCKSEKALDVVQVVLVNSF
jgi:High-temperature-induced dauer-formation protein